MFTSDPNVFLMFNRHVGACTLFYSTVSTPPQERFTSCCYSISYKKTLNNKIFTALFYFLYFSGRIQKYKEKRKDRSGVNLSRSATLGFIGEWWCYVDTWGTMGINRTMKFRANNSGIQCTGTYMAVKRSLSVKSSNLSGSILS